MTDTSRRYVVTGIHPVCGARPGREFTASLPESQERALVEGGAIRLVRSQRPARRETVAGDVKGVQRTGRPVVDRGA